MNTKPISRTARASGMTIIEMSVTLALLIGLAGVTAFSIGGYREWKLGKQANATLQSVYIAQKSFMADRPTVRLADVTEAQLLPYLPNGAVEMPKIEALDGTMLSVNFNVMPPVISGDYDPSGADSDGVWDIGRL